jgi:hypothetical protein
LQTDADASDAASAGAGDRTEGEGLVLYNAGTF